MTWVAEVVEILAEGKRAHLPFAASWTNAIQRHRPVLHEIGVSRSHVEDTLFDQSGADALKVFRRFCMEAYEDAPAPDGSPSRLRGLRAALEPFAEEDYQDHHVGRRAKA